MKIRSKRIVLKEGVKAGILEIEEGRIKAVLPYEAEADVDYDAENNRIIPGIFDTHNHGTMGWGLRDTDSPENEVRVKNYLKGLAAQGVTCIFPTAGLGSIKTCARLAKSQQDGAKIMGIHSEGPWLNRVGEKGIRTGWPEVTLAAAEKMLEDGDGYLRLVGISPEIPGADEIIRFFLDHGVTMAFTHSDCNYEQACAAIDKGLSVSTHLMNVMVGIHHRDVGGAGACLLSDKVTCELICDGLHVSNPMIQLILKIKPHDMIEMISDCSELSGAPVGKYRRPASDMIVNVTDDGFLLTDTGRLMGSSKPVLYGIGNLVENIGLPIEEVCRMSSYTVAVKYGFEKERGSIEPGKYADLVIISDSYEAVQTYSEGRRVYDNRTDKDLFNQQLVSELRID